MIFILIQIKLIFTAKSLYLALFLKWEFFETQKLPTRVNVNFYNCNLQVLLLP